MTPISPRPSRTRATLPLGLLLGLTTLLLPRLSSATDSAMLAVGVGAQRMPAWPGAKNDRGEPLPYLDIELPGIGSLSTLDGLQIELLHGKTLHGGIYGSYQWGRSNEDLRNLGGIIPSLSTRLTLGGYLEWQLTRQLDLGTNLSHDAEGAGAYLNLYADADLPQLGVLHQGISLRFGMMNAAAMNRFFGVGPAAASTLGIPTWHPGGGGETAALEYDLFVPTSKHFGMALGLVYGHLLGNAERSPLVTRFGSRTQISESLAFVYHP